MFILLFISCNCTVRGVGWEGRLAVRLPLVPSFRIDSNFFYFSRAFLLFCFSAFLLSSTSSTSSRDQPFSPFA